jgi:hypothetical protein
MPQVQVLAAEYDFNDDIFFHVRGCTYSDTERVTNRLLISTLDKNYDVSKLPRVLLHRMTPMWLAPM